MLFVATVIIWLPFLLPRIVGWSVAASAFYVPWVIMWLLIWGVAVLYLYLYYKKAEHELYTARRVAREL
jgi:fatty acid desaturase